MPKKIVTSDEVTIVEAKRLMEKTKELSEFQRRTYDYTSKFAKTDVRTAKNLVKKLEKKCNLSKKEAIQIINCLPKNIEELRSILTVKGKVILVNELEDILSIINETVKKTEHKISKSKEKEKSKA